MSRASSFQALWTRRRRIMRSMRARGVSEQDLALQFGLPLERVRRIVESKLEQSTRR